MLRRPALLSFAAWIAFAALLRLTILPPEHCPPFDRDAALAAARGTAAWMEHNQKADGSYVYEYDARSGSESAAYNEVRHAGVTMTLYQAAGRLGDAAAMAAADRGLDWERRRLIRRDGWAALTGAPGAPAILGATALMTVGLAERRLATGDTSNDGLMHELGAFMVAMQRPDGGFSIGWDDAARAPIDGTSKYYPGESLWALALLHEAFPNDVFERPARAAAHFLSTRRDDVEGVKFPPLADQWTAYGLAEMAEWGLGDEEIAYGRELAARFGFLVRSESQRGDNFVADAMRGSAPRGAGMGTWIEALAALWRLSNTDPRMADLREPIHERLVCGAAILAGLQSEANDPRERGALFRDGITRMDDQQHSFSGFLYTADAIEGRTRREPGR